MPYRLLAEFESLFAGHRYLHRNSSLGDFVAMQIFEDLASLGSCQKLSERVATRQWAINTQNKRHGVQARRGDGTFGEIVPGELPLIDPGYRVARSRVATVEIGAEVKILAKAMIKQIDRVIGDLQKQTSQFRQGGGSPICVGIVGINHAAYCVSYEGPDREHRTDGRGNRHPIQEAAEAERRLRQYAAPSYDEFIVLRYRATNETPYDFSWVNRVETQQDYGAALVRICRLYQQRF